MFVNLYKRKFTVFLSAVTDDMADERRVLGKVLDNAGIAVVDAEGGSTSGGDGSRSN